jgi:hypothetical protein
MLKQRETGSALLVALITLALASLMIFASATVANQIAAEAVKEQQKDAVDKFSQFIEAIASNADTCNGTGTMNGLTFVNPTTHAVGKDQFVLVAGGPASQDVRLPSNFETSPGVARVIKGADVADSTKAVFDTFNKLTVEKLTIQTPRQLDPNTYQVDLIQQSSVGSQLFAPRRLGNLTLAFTAGTLTGCILKQSAQAMCEDMGCRYNLAAMKQKCVCGFPALSCAQTPGQPMNYIAGIDTTTNPPTPICRTFKASCLASKGRGFAISGVDTTGMPICEAVESTAVAAATPTPTPTATPVPTPTPLPPSCSLCSVIDAPQPAGFFSSNCTGAIVGPFGCDYGASFRGNCGPTACGGPTPTPTPTPTPAGFACTVMFPTMWDDGAGGNWFCDARARAPVGMNIGDTFTYGNDNGGHSKTDGTFCAQGMGVCDGSVDISCTAGGLVITSQTCVGP